MTTEREIFALFSLVILLHFPPLLLAAIFTVYLKYAFSPEIVPFDFAYVKSILIFLFAYTWPSNMNS